MARPVIQVSLLILLGLFSFHSSGQIIVEYGAGITPDVLVQKIVGEGVQYSNVSYQGPPINATGIFSGGSSTNLGLDAGIVLTSGHAGDIPGANTSSLGGWDRGEPGDPDLDSIATGNTYDACVLEFDFFPEKDTLRLKYVFGSEEYNEQVGMMSDDICGIFITGPDPMGGMYTSKNIALVPGTPSMPISINTVNNGWALGGTVPTGPCENCQYFNDNTGGETLQYDAFTTVLTAWILVDPCEEYHVKIAVADVSDKIVDSGIFLEANSITSHGTMHEVLLNPPGLGENLHEGVIGADVVFHLPDISWSPFVLEFETILGTANPSAYPDGDFEEEIPLSVSFGSGSDSATIHVMPVYDNIIEAEEIVQIVYQNTLGCTPFSDTVELIIEDHMQMMLNLIPNLIICEGMEVDLWAQVENGYPPYSFYWEPGGFTNDTITVSPDTTTTYYVYVTDVIDTVVDSVKVFVIPNHGGFLSYAFEKAINPALPFTVTGEILDDSVSLTVPAGTNLEGLIATFTLNEGAMFAGVNNEPQVSGVTPNDFSSPVVYQVFSPGGCIKEWTVTVNMATGTNEKLEEKITIAPNPVKDHLVITHATGSEVRLFNTVGTEVLQKLITRSPFKLDLQHLQYGIYFLKIVKENKETTRKIILAR